MSGDLQSLIALAKQHKPKPEAPREEVKADLPAVVSLSLDLDEDITKDTMMQNVGIERVVKGDPEAFKRARRKVGKLTTGASAAAPLLCRGNDCPFRHKCLPVGTLVLTPTGYRPINTLKAGDPIYSINTEGHVELDKVMAVHSVGYKPVYRITSGSYTLRLTRDHRVWSLINGRAAWRTIEHTLTSAEVFILDDDSTLSGLTYGDLTTAPIDDCVLLDDDVPCYDLTILNNPNFIAQGFMVHNCSYYAEGIHEDGEDCLKEQQLIEFWTKKYFEDLDINPQSISEMHTLSRLVEITIMDLRMSEYLAINNPDLMMDVIGLVDPEGNPIYQKDTSVAFDVKERLEKQKLKLLESLNSTREKRIKTAIEVESRSKSESLKEKLDKLAAALRAGHNMKDVTDAEWSE